MANRQYVGARYVPKFADPVEWNNALSYEALTIVTHLGNSFTSKKPVPAGVDIGNTEYWVNTGNYNEQVSEYQKQVTNISAEVANISAIVDGLAQDGVSLKNPPNGLTPCDPTAATDSTAAFNAILSYARQNKKSILVDGIYKLSDVVLLKTGDRFIGLGTNTSNYDTTTFTDLSGVISGFVFNGTDGFKAVGRQESIILFNFAIINVGSSGNTIAIKGDRLRSSYIVHTQNVNFSTGLSLGVDAAGLNDDNAMFNTFVDYVSVRCNTGINLYGGSTGNFGGNACHNQFIGVGIDTYGVGIRLDDSDNNTFINCHCFQRGGDWAYQFSRGARSNYFYHAQGRALSDNGANNWIYGYDRENGQSMPYCQAGSLNIITSDGVLLMQKDGVNRYFQSGKEYDYTGITPSSGSLAVNTNTAAGQPLFYVVGADGSWKGQLTIV